MVQARASRRANVCRRRLSACTGFYIGDGASLRYCDMTTVTVSLVAGSEYQGWEDGLESDAQFMSVYGLLSSSDGYQLYIADLGNNAIRLFDTETRMVSTLVGGPENAGFDDGFANGVGGPPCFIARPEKLVFDRSRDVKVEWAVFIATVREIRRFEFHSGEMTTCKWIRDPRGRFSPRRISSTPSGLLLVSCFHTNAIHVYNPRTGDETMLIAGKRANGSRTTPDTLGYEIELVVVEDERCAYINDASQFRIKHIPLPAHLFVVGDD